jgi:hypothetical protein
MQTGWAELVAFREKLKTRRLQRPQKTTIVV